MLKDRVFGEPNPKSSLVGLLLYHDLVGRDPVRLGLIQYKNGKGRKRCFFRKRVIKQKFKEGDNCAYCGESMFKDCRDKNRRPTIDHVIPVSSGEINPFDESNIEIVCYRCNTRKGSEEVKDLFK